MAEPEQPELTMAQRAEGAKPEQPAENTRRYLR